MCLLVRAKCHFDEKLEFERFNELFDIGSFALRADCAAGEFKRGVVSDFLNASTGMRSNGARKFVGIYKNLVYA